MLRLFCRAVILGSILLSVHSTAIADVPTAQKYVNEAKKLANDKATSYWTDARKKLELAELELDGVPADQKKPVAAEIAALRKTLDEQDASANKEQFQRDLKRIMESAESDAGNLATWPGTQRRFEEFAKKPGVAEALGKDLDLARTRIETMAKLYTKNKLAETLTVAESAVSDLEKKWSEKKGEIANSVIAESLQREVDRTLKIVREIPESHDMRKSLEPRVVKIQSALGSATNAGMAAEVIRRMKDSWELDARETTGWEQESAGVSLEQYCRESSPKMSAFGAPKTVELIKVAGPWLKNRASDPAYQQAKNVPEVKAVYDGVAQAEAKARARMEQAAEAIVAQAEKTAITDQNLNGFNRLVDDIRLNLGSSEKSEPLQSRVKTLLTNRQSAVAAGDKAKDEYYASMTKQAAAHWPDMKKKFTTETGFDPQSASKSKGKLFSLTTDNLMGYRFKPGDFPFATTVNGRAVAGKFDPVVAGAIQEVEKKLGRSLGDDDNDGKWEIVIRVEGTTGQMMARKQVEGDLTLNGTKVGTYRGEYSEPTEAAIVTIVAAKCGPLAVSASEGMITETGETVVKSSNDPKLTGSGSSSDYGFFGTTLRLLIGLAAGLAALIVSGFKPLTDIKAIRERADSLTLPLAGVGAVAVLFGLYWLLAWFFRGLFAPLAIVLTGAFVVAIVLNKIGILKAEWVETIRPYGIALGLSCTAITLIGLFTRGSFWVI